MSKIAVIIPCYNEAMTIGKVVDDFSRELPEAEIYVYDNNSSDGTSRIAREHGAIVRFEPRQGKGNVCRQMFRDIDADCYLMVDGDDTYDETMARAMCEPILKGEADMTVGDRLSNGTYAEENKRAFHGFGNNLVRAMIKWIYGYSFDDVMTGYRAMSRPFVKTFPVLSEGLPSSEVLWSGFCSFPVPGTYCWDSGNCRFRTHRACYTPPHCYSSYCLHIPLRSLFDNRVYS